MVTKSAFDFSSVDEILPFLTSAQQDQEDSSKNQQYDFSEVDNLLPQISKSDKKILKMSDKPEGWNDDEEKSFQDWYLKQAEKYNLDKNPDNPEHHYNYRFAFRNKLNPNEEGHWPSEFKDEDHRNRFIGGEDTITGEKIEDKYDFSSVEELVKNDPEIRNVQTQVPIFDNTPQVSLEVPDAKFIDYKGEDLGTLAKAGLGATKISGKGIVRSQKYNPDELGRLVKVRIYSETVPQLALNSPNHRQAADKYLQTYYPQYNELNYKYRNTKEFGGFDIVDLTGASVKKVGKNEYEISFRESRGSLDYINAFARKGIQGAFDELEKQHKDRNEYIEDRARIYNQNKLLEEVQVENPRFKFLSSLSGAGFILNNEASVRAGIMDAAQANFQLLHNLQKLGEGLWTGNKYGYNSDEYRELIEQDLRDQQALNLGTQVGSEEGSKTLKGKIVRGLTSAIVQLPKYQLAGSLGIGGLSTLTYLENLHRGNREAAIEAFKMGALVGASHGIGGFLNQTRRYDALTKQPKFEYPSLTEQSLADKIKIGFTRDKVYDILDETVPKSSLGQVLSNSAPIYNLSKISPLGRQLLLRGIQGLAFPTISSIPSTFYKPINQQTFQAPNLTDAITEFTIGFGLPVGKQEGKSEFNLSIPEKVGIGEHSIWPRGLLPLPKPIEVTTSGRSFTTIDRTGNIITSNIIENSTVGGKVNKDAIVELSKSSIDSISKASNQSDITVRSLGNKSISQLEQLKRDIIDKGQQDESFQYLQAVDLIIKEKESSFISEEKGFQAASISRVQMDLDKANLTLLELKRLRDSGAFKVDSLPETLKRQQGLNEAIAALEYAIPEETKEWFAKNEDLVRDGYNRDNKENVRKNLNPKLSEQEIAKDGKDVSNIVNQNQAELGGLATRLRVGLKNAEEHYGEDGKANKQVTQNQAFRSRNEVKKRAKKIKGQVGILNLTPENALPIGFADKLLKSHSTELAQVAAFHVEDLIIRNGEPNFDLFKNRFVGDFGDTVIRSLGDEKLRDIYNKGLDYYNSNNADPFFSGLKQEAVEKLPNRFDAKQARNVLGQKKFETELHFTEGVEELLLGAEKSGRKISKEELINKIQENQIRVEEVLKGAKDLPTGYEVIEHTNAPYAVVKNNIVYGYGETKDKAIANFFEIKGEHSSTKYGLKDYTGEKLELEGGEGYKEFLLISPIRQIQKPYFQMKSVYDHPEYQRIFNEYESQTRRIQDENFARTNEYVYDDITRKELNELSNKFRLDLDRMEREIVEENKIAEKKYREQETIYNENEQNRYKSGHWDESNVLAHIRFNERIDADGKRLLFIEEIQSDWNQTGRTQGYKVREGDRLREIEKQLYEKFINDKFKDIAKLEVSDRYENLDEFSRYIMKSDVAKYLGEEVSNEWTKLKQQSGDIPQNPFMGQNWKELSIKRILRYAAENGFDRVGWTTTEQQRERYKKIAEGKQIEWSKNSDGTYNISLIKSDGTEYQLPEMRGISLERIGELTNNEVVNRIRESQKRNPQINAIDDVLENRGRYKPTEKQVAIIIEARSYVNNTGKSIRAFDSYLMNNNRFEDSITLNASMNDFGLAVSDTTNRIINLSDTIKLGEGYGDYSKGYPIIFNKIGKRFGVKVGETQIDTSKLDLEYESEGRAYSDFLAGKDIYGLNPNTGEYERIRFQSDLENYMTYAIKDYSKEKVHSIDITPSMKKSLLKEGQSLYGTSGLESLKPNQPLGVRNRIVSRETFNPSKETLARAIQVEADSKGTVFSSGLNPEAFIEQAKLLYKGIKDLATFSSELISRFGNSIKPYTEAIYNYVHELGDNFKVGLDDWIEEREKIAKREPFITRKSERGFINLGVSSSEVLGALVNKYERLKRNTKKLERNLARATYLAQRFPDTFGPIYNTFRDIQGVLNTYQSNIVKNIREGESSLDQTSRDKVSRVIHVRNSIDKRPYSVAELLAGDTSTNRPALNTDEIKLYENFRRSQDLALNIREEQKLYREYQRLSKLKVGTPAYLDAQANIAKIKAHYKELREQGYVTLQRFGDVSVYAEDPAFPVGDDRRTLYNRYDSDLQANRKLQEWTSKGYVNGQIYDTKSLSKLFRTGKTLTPATFDDLVLKSGVNLRNPVVKLAIEDLRTEVLEQFATTSYEIPRKYIRGYDEDYNTLKRNLGNQLKAFSNSFYGDVAKEEAGQALAKTGLASTDPEFAKFIQDYINDETTAYNKSWWNRKAAQARKFTYFMNLGYDFAQFIMNAGTQPMTQTYSYFQREGNLKNIQAESYFLEGGKLTKELLREQGLGKLLKPKTSSKVNSELRDFYQRAQDEHIVTAEFTESLLEEIDPVNPFTGTPIGKGYGTFKKGVKKIVDHSSLFTRAGERVTRTHAFSEAYLVGKNELGLKGEELYQFMRKAVDATQGHFSKAENPAVIRSMGEFGKLLYQFNSYNQIWFENLALGIRSDIQNRSLKITPRHLAPITILSGISGLPLSAFARAMYTIIFNKDPKEEAEKLLGEQAILRNLALYGVTGSAGVSSKLGIRVPLMDNIADILTQPEDEVSFQNFPAVSTAVNVISGTKEIVVGKGWKEKRRGVEKVLPRFLKNPVRASRFASEGIKEKNGTSITSKSKITPLTLVGQSFGVTPTSTIEHYEGKKFKSLSKLAKKTKKSIRRNFR